MLGTQFFGNSVVFWQACTIYCAWRGCSLLGVQKLLFIICLREWTVLGPGATLSQGRQVFKSPIPWNFRSICLHQCIWCLGFHNCEYYVLFCVVALRSVVVVLQGFKNTSVFFPGYIRSMFLVRRDSTRLYIVITQKITVWMLRVRNVRSRAQTAQLF